MLRQDVVDLASESLNAIFLTRQKEYPDNTRRVLERLAFRGIVGGPTYSLLGRQAYNEITQRASIVADELRRACESKGVHYHKSLTLELNDALDQLALGRWNDVLADWSHKARAVPTFGPAVQTEYDGLFARTAGDALRKGKSDLSHFTAQLRTRRGESWWGEARRLVYIAIGFFLGVASDIIRIHLTHQP